VSESEPGGSKKSGWSWLTPRVAMVVGVLAWLWPIGLGGRMPVGGDSTQFSIGLMAFLKTSIQARRLPLWNDLWGFGFPGVAESQMGVFYPPHLLLYGTLPTETAYLASLVLHTLWAALGAAWAARKLGTSETGAALAGFAWVTSGFYLIHLPHQWGYTVGSWMPWAWGMAWQVSRGEGTKLTPWLFSAVLALQVLPGHFQLAFVTEVGVLVLALVGSGRSIGRRVVVILALAGMLPLASMQLWPTYRLARLSDAHRDFEYLSGFAVTPVHLVNYVAPGLFHRSPLWRPLAWDTFHTSPEELLGYVGLVPLFLALGAIRRGIKSDAAVRTLTVLALVTLIFGFGPYVPGFSSLIKLPGFSFFRAPARWSLATNLALTLLAGRGFDGWQAWPRPGRSARRFVLASLAATLVMVGGFELALASAKGEGWKAVASGFDRVLKILPWADQPGEKSFRAVMAEAYRPQADLRAQSAQARLEGKPPGPGQTLAAERWAIYSLELSETGALLVALLAISSLTRRPRAFAAGLLTLTLMDGLIQARHRPFDLGPCRSLVNQSPVLTRMAQEPRGTRTLDPARNLFMVAGVTPVSAYRTLDLPAPGGLLQIARGPIGDKRVADAIRLSGVEYRVIDPLDRQAVLTQSGKMNRLGLETTIDDPSLAGWLYGEDFARSLGQNGFAIVRTSIMPARAWLMSSVGLDKLDILADPFALIEKFRSASPLPSRSETPERDEVEVRIADPNPSMVVLSKTFDPEWEAWWSNEAGDRRDARVVKVLGGWQGVAVPEPGRWTLHLEYPGRAVWVGLTVASTAWSLWLMGFIRAWTSRGVATNKQPETIA
jgi:hypothetical protein